MNQSSPHRNAIRLLLAAAVLAIVMPASAQEEITGIVEPVSARDHVRGPRTAPVKLIEFGDTECPLCKRLHPTMKRLVDDYRGQVAWVFRHFPIAEIHPKAPKEAEATECAAELGGEVKFWAYLDRLYEITPSGNRLDPVELPRIAQYIGLERAPFEQCLASGRHTARVAADVVDGFAAGAPGTPYTVIVAPSGKAYEVVGNQPYETLRLVIDIALTQK
ncbi:MAG TPA: thioredoxin domain-containing protein [Acidiferrobacterales bacterium]|nr:thioredoxin domain-containing protein [Acidiferrobacterales bacterium]